MKLLPDNHATLTNLQILNYGEIAVVKFEQKAHGLDRSLWAASLKLAVKFIYVLSRKCLSRHWLLVSIFL